MKKEDYEKHTQPPEEGEFLMILRWNVSTGKYSLKMLSEEIVECDAIIGILSRAAYELNEKVGGQNVQVDTIEEEIPPWLKN